MPASVVAQGARRVSAATLARVFWRSLFLQASWNPRGMQNVGFAYAIAPALTDLYPDPAERARAAARHLEFFNCHPYMAAAILGGAVRLEERVANGEATPQSVSAFKSALGPPFAALGDGFFWLALRPTAALAAAATEPFLGMGCVLVFLALYNSVHLLTRIWLFTTGYLALRQRNAAPQSLRRGAGGRPGGPLGASGGPAGTALPRAARRLDHRGCRRRAAEARRHPLRLHCALGRSCARRALLLALWRRMADDIVEKNCTVRNKMGLHARPAAMIVQTANKYPCDVTLVKDGQDVNAKSIMGVLMLAASQGTVITVRAEGEEAQQCADAICALFEKGFNEAMS